MIRVLLWVESVLTFPVFVVAWLVSALWVACAAGYAVAKMPTDKKRETLHRMAKHISGGAE